MNKAQTNYRVATIFILFLTTFFSFGQLSEDQKRLLNDRDDTYLGIDSILRPYRKDTTLLLDFIASAKNSEYHEGLSYAYNQLGINARNFSNYSRAVKWHELAIEAGKKSENVDFTIIALNMLGVVNRRQEKVRAALDFHKQALEMAEKSEKRTVNNLRSIAVSRNSIGNIYISLRQPELAIEQFSAAIKIEEEIGNKLGLAINHQNLGGIYEEIGELEKALISYRKSLVYNEEINSDLGRLICHNSIGQIYLKQNKAQEALDIIKPTVQKAMEMGDLYYVTMSKMNLGWAYYEIDALNKSEKYLKEALAEATGKNLAYYVAESYRLLGEVSEQRGNYKAALAYNKLYAQNEEKYLNESNKEYMADLISKYDSDKKKNQIEILEKENELVNQKLSNNRYILTISLICISLAGLLLFILYRQNKLRNEKEFLAIEQTMMRSQMNPHFIFNSLNSIKLYIINSDKEKAVYYLNKFSKLIRTILATAKEKDISLSEELDTMELYMNIENIRFSNKIQFTLNIDDNIDTKTIKVPSLILQPFLENSIWHGLSAKEGNKNITLNVKKPSATEIIIEIIDNGIGRLRSSDIKSQKLIKNKSIGISLTKQRLNNYFKDVPGEHSLKIQDLLDQNNKATGTKVILRLPFNIA